MYYLVFDILCLKDCITSFGGKSVSTRVIDITVKSSIHTKILV